VPFAGWILRVARNAALDRLRSRRQIPCPEVRLNDAGYDQVGSDRLRSLPAVLRLPEDQREVMILRHFAGLTPGEIAVVLGKSESSVHGLHHRGRGTVKDALRELGAAPVTSVA
jgi:RNA polymerase sigma-70 factor, ECF subfamily